MTVAESEDGAAVVTPVIMCGGAGTRLWPLSTSARPKQLHALSTELSLLQETALRGAGEAQGVRFTPPIVVCSAKHASEIERQLKAVDVAPAALVVEPMPRSTAPVAAVAARLVSQRFPGALMLLLPADHVMPEPDGFRAVLGQAAAAASDHIVTLGVTPTAPEVGFGYIKEGERLAGGEVFKVERFVEKPDRSTAEAYLAEGGYVWNAGIFLASADLLVRELERFVPVILKQTDLAIAHGRVEGAVLHLDAEAFGAAPEDSIDYAVMEKTACAAVVPMATPWFDVGGWEALHALGPHDEAGNRLRGEVLAIDTERSLVWAADRRVVVAGLKDVLVVENEGVVVVMPLAMTGTEMRRVYKAAGAFIEGLPARKPTSELERVATELDAWLKDDALPLWWAKGADKVQGGWYETLGLDGDPVPGERRARVQARQTFVYAAAHLRGCGPGLQAVEHGLDYLLTRYRRDDGLIRATVADDGSAKDEEVTLYNQAFAFIAMAYAYEAMGKPAELLDDARDLRRRVGATLRNAAGGFQEAGEHTFQSNPHMHLFESCLDWERLDDDPAWAALADEIGTLAINKFIDAEGGFLREFFDQDWNPAPGKAGEVVEPGHQFEWSWLLTRWGQRRGRPDVIAKAQRLYGIGAAHGVDARGVAFDEMNLELTPARPTSRLWPQTERLKAALKAAELAGGADVRARHEAEAASAGRALMLYLDAPLRGAWKDKLSPDGVFTDEPAPASSFYHITLAIHTLADYVKGQASQ